MDSEFLRDIELPNTLALPARAQRALVAVSTAQLQARLTSMTEERVFVLGSGSNVVLPDALPGLTVLMRIKGIAEKKARNGARIFEVGAGESWQGFVRFCLGQGLGGGIENLTLIPGTVGAAPIQNIGAYGVEVAQFIDAVQVLDAQSPSHAVYWLGREDCEFGYRDSLFKQQPGRWIVTQVRFKLPSHRDGRVALGYAGVTDMLERKGITRLTPVAIAEAIARLRRSKLPDFRKHPNAGSFFKNPVLTDAQMAELRQTLPAASKANFETLPSWPHAKGCKIAAAALIDRAGFKRQQAGGVGVWYRQPLVLVNTGGANASTLSAFAAQIQQRVQAQFGIALEQEPVQMAPVRST